MPAKTPGSRLRAGVATRLEGNRQAAGIVFFFGGGWTNGTIKHFEPQANYLASRGMVAARADYRVKSRHGVTPEGMRRGCQECRPLVAAERRQAGRRSRPDRGRRRIGGRTHRRLHGLHAGTGRRGGGHAVSSKPNALVLFNPVLRFDGIPAVDGDGSATMKPWARRFRPPLPAEGQPADDDLLRHGRPAGRHGRRVHGEVEGTGAPGRDVHRRRPRARLLQPAAVAGENDQRMDEFLVSIRYLKPKAGLAARR